MQQKFLVLGVPVFARMLPSGDMAVWHPFNSDVQAVIEPICRGRGYWQTTAKTLPNGPTTSVTHDDGLLPRRLSSGSVPSHFFDGHDSFRCPIVIEAKNLNISCGSAAVVTKSAERSLPEFHCYDG